MSCDNVVYVYVHVCICIHTSIGETVVPLQGWQSELPRDVSKDSWRSSLTGYEIGPENYVWKSPQVTLMCSRFANHNVVKCAVTRVRLPRGTTAEGKVAAPWLTAPDTSPFLAAPSVTERSEARKWRTQQQLCLKKQQGAHALHAVSITLLRAGYNVCHPVAKCVLLMQASSSPVIIMPPTPAPSLLISDYSYCPSVTFVTLVSFPHSRSWRLFEAIRALIK